MRIHRPFAAVLFGLFASAGAQAQVGNSGYSLPLALASEAALEAIRVCEASGYKVSVAIVDPNGVVKLAAKGDHSTIHTKDSSFGKAYTMATTGPVLNVDTTGEVVERLQGNPQLAAALANLPNMLFLRGAVAIRAKGEIVAGLGVGGAPGGDKDEVCALAGIAKIRDRLPK